MSQGTPEAAIPSSSTSYRSTSTATIGTSFSEAQEKEEYTGDFKGEYGLDYWNRRRTAWIAGGPIQSALNSQSSQGPRRSSILPGIADPPRNGNARKTSKTVVKLCEVMAPPFAEEDDAVWNNGVRAVWKSLSHGDKLKYPLPLPIVIKILRGGWLRDGTWPIGLPIPEDDIGIPESGPVSTVQEDEDEEDEEELPGLSRS